MKISIITATFNSDSTIERTIQSVLSQDYPSIEHIIIDGQSTDNTLAILHKYSTQISTILSEPDAGIYDALNKGIQLSTGDIVGFLHADDFFANNTVLSAIANAFEVNNVDAVYGDLVYFSAKEPDKLLRYWKSEPFELSMLKNGWMPAHPTFFVKRSVYQTHGLFDISFQIAADYDIMLRFLSKARISTHYLPQIITKMQWGGTSNKSFGNILVKMKEDYRVLKRNEIGGIISLISKNLRKVSQFFKR